MEKPVGRRPFITPCSIPIISVFIVVLEAIKVCTKSVSILFLFFPDRSYRPIQFIYLIPLQVLIKNIMYVDLLESEQNMPQSLNILTL